MSDTSVPFNIFLLLPTSNDFKLIRPVKTLDIFEGGTKQFHPDGLFSTETFGKIGDPKRSARYSYIDFKIPVFHPVIFNILGKLKRLYLEILTSKTFAVWDNVEKDFVKSNQLDGETGFYFFEKHWKDIDLKTNNSDTRTENINLLKRFKDNALCSILVVMPAGLRDYEIKDNGQEEEEEINVLYRRMLSLANSISANSYKLSPEIYNQSRVNIQLTFCDIYDLIINSIKGKKKLYMGKWATRAIHDSTRNVITTTNTVIQKLGDKSNPGFNSMIVGVFQTAKSIAPVMRHRVREFFSKSFNDPKLPVKVIDNKTLTSKLITIHPKEFDIWMTDEGIDKIINTFSVEALRNEVITVGGEYIALIWQDEKSFKLFYSIEELPEGFDRKYVRPLRLSDLFYYLLFQDASEFPAFATRYPITGFGSIYPVTLYLRSTIDAKRLTLLSDSWEKTDIVAPEFPGTGSWFNSMSPPSNRLSKSGADFDGDKMSLIVLISDEAKEEVVNNLKNGNIYIGTDGKIAFSIVTDTVNFLMSNLISDI